MFLICSPQRDKEVQTWPSHSPVQSNDRNEARDPSEAGGNRCLTEPEGQTKRQTEKRRWESSARGHGVAVTSFIQILLMAFLSDFYFPRNVNTFSFFCVWLFGVNFSSFAVRSADRPTGFAVLCELLLCLSYKNKDNFISTTAAINARRRPLSTTATTSIKRAGNKIEKQRRRGE